MPVDTPGETYAQLPPAEAVRFFQEKLALPTRRWTDLLRGEHDLAFVTAGATKMQFLEDLAGEVEKAIEDGTTYREFRKGFDEAVARHGWPYPGRDDSDAYRAWRTRLIYETNLSTAYAAGRYEQMTDPDVLEQRPYWLYRHGGSENPRPHHLSWDGLVLRADDPWWDTHAPPGGFGCSCTVYALSSEEVKRRGLEIAEEAPDVQTREWTNPNTGEVEQIPEGIDPGWNYTPGRSRLRAQTPAFRADWPESAEDFPIQTRPSTLPEPRSVDPSVVMAQGLDEEEYVDAFLEEMGTSREEPPSFFEDVAGEVLPISDELFREAEGALKVTKRDREPYVRLYARTLRDPDEVWVALEPYEKEVGIWRLVRYYVARWNVGGEDVPATAIFRWTRDWWEGVTSFDPADERRLNKRRHGLLLYQRGADGRDDQP